jgi:hypothetical protein
MSNQRSRDPEGRPYLTPQELAARMSSSAGDALATRLSEAGVDEAGEVVVPRIAWTPDDPLTTDSA